MADQEDKQQTGTQPAGTGAEPGQQPAATPAAGTFTQADIDRIVKDRLERERAKAKEQYGDYDQLKQAAAKLREIEDANRSEIDKAAERTKTLEAQLAQAEADKARLAQERQDALVRSAIVAKATAARFLDPDDAARFIDMAAIQIKENGAIEGIEPQLEALGKAKPYLLQQTPRLSPTNPGAGSGTGGETDEQRRARLWGRGDTPIGKGPGGGMFTPGGITS